MRRGARAAVLVQDQLRGCVQVAGAALDGVVGVIVEDLIEHVAKSPDAKRKQAATELKNTVSKLI